MTYRKIFIAEQRLKKNIQQNKDKLEVMDRIREYIGRINHDVEMIPEGNNSNLQRLIAELKGAVLSDDEIKMIDEIINNEV